MLKDISLKDIKDFQKRYNENVENKEIESKILKLGLREACLDNKKEYEFNIEVPKIKMYNQHESHQCNIYASLRMIKDILRKTSELDVDSLDISANYIAFFDKLEKVNSLYDELIENNNISIEFINSKVERYIGSYGTFYFCKKNY